MTDTNQAQKTGSELETSRPRPTVLPRTDVLETDDALVLVADVPGATNESIELELVEDVLTLKARAVDDQPEGWTPSGKALELPDYQRSFRIRADLDREGLSATLEHGRLRVVLRKREPRSSRITVHSG